MYTMTISKHIQSACWLAGLAKLTVRQLATCAWALSILQQQSHHLFDILINELLHRPKADFSKATLMQLHQVLNLLHFDFFQPALQL